jgi:hypothetical protein
MFLFEERRGHCEYFATAMALMLRQLGIPARLVNGFRAGEYNRLGDAWIVRQYDAHSWVEAWFYPYGWLEFDPTPPAPPRPRPTFLRSIAQFVDAVSLWWSEEVINYDFAKQFRLAYSLRSSLASAQQQVLGSVRSWAGRLVAQLQGLASPGSGPPVLAAAAILAAAALAGWHLVRRLRSRGLGLEGSVRRLMRRHDVSFLVPSFYREALALLEHGGLTRQRHETGLEFALRLGTHPAAPALGRLTRLHYRASYGGDTRPSDAEDARALLAALRSALTVDTRESKA